MGTRGPVPKEQRSRARDNKARESIVVDDQVRGYELTNRLLESEDDEWHPFVKDWWESFRRSPMAQRLVDDTQWMTSLGVQVRPRRGLGAPRSVVSDDPAIK